MQFSIERNHFFALLERVRGAFGASLSSVERPPMLLLEAKGKKLLLQGCDHAISITETTSHVTISKEGKCVVPGINLRDWLHSLEENVMIHVDMLLPPSLNKKHSPPQEKGGGGQHQQVPTLLKITTEKDSSHLQCLPAEDFPSIDLGKDISSFEMPMIVLTDAIKKTSFAASSDPNRYYLNGIYLHKHLENEKKCLCAAATDGHRLAIHTMPFQKKEPKDFEGVIVSRRTMEHLLGILETYQRKEKDDDNVVSISIHENVIRFALGNLEFLSKLVDGRFPDYRKVIPKESTRFLTQDSKSLGRSVKSVSAAGNKKSETTVTLDLKEDHIIFHAEGTHGKNESMGDGQFQGKPIKLGISGIYLNDIIRCFPTERLRLEMTDENSPMIIRSSKYKDTLHVLMPVNL